MDYVINFVNLLWEAKLNWSETPVVESQYFSVSSVSPITEYVIWSYLTTLCYSLYDRTKGKKNEL